VSFISKEEGTVELHLFDETGKELVAKKQASNALNEIFDLSRFETTKVLFLTINQNGKIHTQKIIRAE